MNVTLTIAYPACTNLVNLKMNGRDRAGLESVPERSGSRGDRGDARGGRLVVLCRARRAEIRTGPHLSLIHISEPTRPY